MLSFSSCVRYRNKLRKFVKNAKMNSSIIDRCCWQEFHVVVLIVLIITQVSRLIILSWSWYTSSFLFPFYLSLSHECVLPSQVELGRPRCLHPCHPWPRASLHICLPLTHQTLKEKTGRDLHSCQVVVTLVHSVISSCSLGCVPKQTCKLRKTLTGVPV